MSSEDKANLDPAGNQADTRDYVDFFRPSQEAARGSTNSSNLPPAAQPITNPIPGNESRKGSFAHSLSLGFLPTASGSQNSLLEAVVGPNHAQANPASPLRTAYAQTQQAPPAQRPSPPKIRQTPGSGSIQSSSRVPSGSEETTSTEKSWDILSDASLRLNEGDDEAVAELEKKVNKRRSNLPHLETELAALEAKIKEAEERLARAQAGTAGQGVQGRAP